MTVPIIIDHSSFPKARDYYNQCRTEPVADRTQVTIGQLVPVVNMTFQSLLEAIVANTSGTGMTVIQVHHGVEMGIVLNLVAGSSQGAGISQLDALTSPLQDDNAVAVPLGITPQQVATLRALRDQVRARRLQRLIIRGCKLGAWESTLQSIKRFTGATTVEAPRLYNSYSRMDFNVHSQNYNHAAHYTTPQDHWYDGGNGAWVGFRVSPDLNALSLTYSNMRASSLTHLRTFLAERFFFSTPQTLGPTGVVLSGQFAPSLAGDAGRFIYPREDAYVEYLRAYSGPATTGLDGLDAL